MSFPDTRCTFTFRDGRRCTMLRTGTRSTICLYHMRKVGKDQGKLSPALEPYIAPGELDNPWAVRRAIKRILALAMGGKLSPQQARVLTNLARLLLSSTRRPRKPARRNFAQRTCVNMTKTVGAAKG